MKKLISLFVLAGVMYGLYAVEQADLHLQDLKYSMGRRSRKERTKVRCRIDATNKQHGPCNFKNHKFEENSDFHDLDLTGADFSGAKLKHADFTNADLTNVNFANTDLSDSKFKGAIITGANFNGAYLTDAETVAGMPNAVSSAAPIQPMIVSMPSAPISTMPAPSAPQVSTEPKTSTSSVAQQAPIATAQKSPSGPPQGPVPGALMSGQGMLR